MQHYIDAGGGCFDEAWRKLAPIHGRDEFLNGRVGVLATDPADLFQAIQPMVPKGSQDFPGIQDRRTMGWVDNLRVQLLSSVEGCQIIGDASGILSQPGRVSSPEDQIPCEKRFGPRPVERQMIPGVTGRDDRDELALIRRDALSILEWGEPRRWSPAGGGGRHPTCQGLSCPGVIPVPMGKEDLDFPRARQGMRKGPNVLVHVRARIDHDCSLPPHQESTGSVEREWPSVSGFDHSGLKGCGHLPCASGRGLASRTLWWPDASAPLCHELLGKLVGNHGDGGLVIGRKSLGLH